MKTLASNVGKIPSSQQNGGPEELLFCPCRRNEMYPTCLILNIEFNFLNTESMDNSYKKKGQQYPYFSSIVPNTFHLYKQKFYLALTRVFVSFLISGEGNHTYQLNVDDLIPS
jgi:hypothetical protein